MIALDPTYQQKRLLSFMKKVDIRGEDECWLWRGGNSGPGRYGTFSVAAQNMTASRASYLLRHGSIADGQFVLHHCDNPRCVNPAHLFSGTAKDNMVDMASKGRQWRQRLDLEAMTELRHMAEEARKCHALKAEAEAEAARQRAERNVIIKRLSAAGWSYRAMSEAIGCSEGLIAAIVRGRTG